MPGQEHLIADVLRSKTFGKAKASFLCCLCLFAFKFFFFFPKNNNKTCTPFLALLSGFLQAAISLKPQFRDTVYTQLVRMDQTCCSSAMLCTKSLLTLLSRSDIFFFNIGR